MLVSDTTIAVFESASTENMSLSSLQMCAFLLFSFLWSRE